MDMADLERQLQASAGMRMRLIATDGVFSMDGDVAPLKEILALARKHDAQVFVDDCHGTGVLGATGRGVDEHWDVLGQVDILNSTLGKALGGATGGYTTGRSNVVQLLRQKSRPYLFSNTLAPAVAGASLEVFRLLSASHELRDKLQHNTDRFRKEMVDVGFKLGHGSHPIMVRICTRHTPQASPLTARLGHRCCRT
jgi:glycine C-acetyltransferase